MFKPVENGEIYAPERLGGQSILLAEDKIVKVGEVDAGKSAA